MNAPAGRKASKKRASVEDSMESNTEEEEVHIGNDKDGNNDTIVQENSKNDADHSHEEGELVGDYDDGVILAMNLTTIMI